MGFCLLPGNGINTWSEDCVLAEEAFGSVTWPQYLEDTWSIFQAMSSLEAT